MPLDPLACPVCGDESSVQKVSAIVLAGTSTHAYVGTWAGSGYTFGEGGGPSVLGGTTTLEGGSQTALSRSLSPPAEPTAAFRPGFWAVAALIIGGLGVFGSCNGSGFEGEYYGLWIIVTVVAGCFLYDKWKGYERQKQAAAVQRPTWERAMARWQVLFYCFRCDRVFLPGDPDSAPPHAMMEFLYRQDGLTTPPPSAAGAPPGAIQGQHTASGRAGGRSSSRDADQPAAGSLDSPTASLRQVHPGATTGTSLRVEAQAVRAALTKVAIAAATDDARPVLSGVFIEARDQQMTLVAADGFRLAVHRVPLIEPITSRVGFIVPVQAMHALGGLLAGVDQPVELVVGSGSATVTFRLPSSDWQATRIAGTFPDYRPLIPESYLTRVIVSVSDLRIAIREVVTDSGDAAIRFQVTPSHTTASGTLTLSTGAPPLTVTRRVIAAEVTGETAHIAFNAAYLSDALDVLHYDDVALTIAGSASPGTLRPVDEDDYAYVVMPMFVDW